MWIVEDKDFHHVLWRRFQEPHSFSQPFCYSNSQNICPVRLAMVLSQNFWRPEEELGQLHYTRAEDLDMTCMDSSGWAIGLCEVWCFCESFSRCPERCWSSYRNMGCFALEAFQLGQSVSGQSLSRQSWCLQLHNPMNSDLRYLHSFLEKLSQDPLKSSALRSTLKELFLRPKIS